LKLPLPAFIREHPHLAAFALLATATSGFGQTFFVSVFGSGIRDAFNLSHASYGTYYSLATLCSALILLKAGTLVDRWPLHRVTLLAVLLLALGCLVIGLAPHVGMLVPGFLLIRFGGQAMLSHIGITTAGRYFVKDRGKAMAMTAAGFPLAEAVLPASAAAILVLGGWRMPWFLGAGLLVLVALPALISLARHAPPPQAVADQATGGTVRDLTRAQALRDPGLYMILPAALAVPFTVTAILFHQTAIADLRDWPLERVGVAFTGFALGHLLSLIAAGPLVDRIGAHRALPLALAPMTCGLLVLAFSNTGWTLFLYLGLTGISLGGVGTAGGAIWPERYGIRHIGAIRSVAQAVMVLSTAVSPILVGTLLDWQVTPAAIGSGLAAATVMAAVLALAAPPVRPE
jgi:MFS family permease